MRSNDRMKIAQWLGSGLAAAALLALGALWRLDRARAWESPRWDDPGLVVLHIAARADGAGRAEDTGRADGTGRAEDPGPADGSVETWAVAVNPGCLVCRGSLARGLAIRGLARVPVRIAVLFVDTKHRPSSAILASLSADELRWDSTGAWRRRWGHRVYGELLCFDRSGRFVRSIAPLGATLADRRALRVGESLRRGGGS